MTEHAGVVRDEAGLRAGLAEPPSTGVTREAIPPIPKEIAALMREVSHHRRQRLAEVGPSHHVRTSSHVRNVRGI